MGCGNGPAARQLAAEIREQLGRGGYSAKETQELLRQKDGLVGGGQHHRIRNVGANQIAKDLEDFADTGHHD
jgi:hypothetical protein